MTVQFIHMLVNPDGCVCTSECEHPCMFRVGDETEQRCCAACAALPGDDDYVPPFSTNRDYGDEQDAA